MIHQQDVRRPLGIARVIPADRLSVVLSSVLTRWVGTLAGTGARKRANGLHLIATDIGWSAGTGPEVHGPGETLLMALAGRSVDTTELQGDGYNLHRTHKRQLQIAALDRRHAVIVCFYWLGSAAIAGGVLALVGNLLHPRYNGEDFDNYHKIAGSEACFPHCRLVLIPALILVVAGMVAIARSLHSGRGSVLSDYGRLAAIVGGTIAIAQLGVETYAFRQQAVIFVGADSAGQRGAFWATRAIDHLNTALGSSWTIVLLGLVPLLLGIAMLRTGRYPGMARPDQ